MEEKEKQRYGRNKSTVVDKSYINGGEFRKKFDHISDSSELNKLLYKLAKKMLIHRSGTLYEDMYWIDPQNLEIVASELHSEVVEEICYSKHTKSQIQLHRNLITIHSHPKGFPPSIDDFNSNYLRNYELGIVVGHNGAVYMYKSDEIINELYYKILIAQYVDLGYNEDEIEHKILADCMQKFNIFFKEVVIDAK